MNNRNYTKLFSTIVTSSLWDEDSDTRVVWVTMLALQDQYHEVHSSVPGLARVAKVPRAACEKALRQFLSPDRDSRTKTDEGRRIVEIDGGWRLINGQKYRDIMSMDERREYKRVHELERRRKIKERGRGVDSNGQNVDSRGRILAETETEAETKTERGVPPSPQVEPPPGFPTSEDQAADMARAIPADFAKQKFNEAAGVGYVDWNGKPIRSFSHWIKSEFERHKERERTHGKTNIGNTGRGVAANYVNRNDGTYNDGDAGKYRKSGRVVSGEDVQ